MSDPVSSEVAQPAVEAPAVGLIETGANEDVVAPPLLGGAVVATGTVVEVDDACGVDVAGGTAERAPWLHPAASNTRSTAALGRSFTVKQPGMFSRRRVSHEKSQPRERIQPREDEDMPSEDELEATELAQIETDLTELATHVKTWIQDRFLASESAEGLNIVDIAGLVTWLRQWQTHFDSYADTASSLVDAGRPAMEARLAQIRTEIDASIANFTDMAAALPEDQRGPDDRPGPDDQRGPDDQPGPEDQRHPDHQPGPDDQPG